MRLSGLLKDGAHQEARRLNLHLLADARARPFWQAARRVGEPDAWKLERLKVEFAWCVSLERCQVGECQREGAEPHPITDVIALHQPSILPGYGIEWGNRHDERVNLRVVLHGCQEVTHHFGRDAHKNVLLECCVCHLIHLSGLKLLASTARPVL